MGTRGMRGTSLVLFASSPRPPAANASDASNARPLEKRCSCTMCVRREWRLPRKTSAMDATATSTMVSAVVPIPRRHTSPSWPPIISKISAVLLTNGSARRTSSSAPASASLVSRNTLDRRYSSNAFFTTRTSRAGVCHTSIGGRMPWTGSLMWWWAKSPRRQCTAKNPQWRFSGCSYAQSRSPEACTTTCARSSTAALTCDENVTPNHEIL
eukprot:1194670-Prorocentrum_minimum.AAC.2